MSDKRVPGQGTAAEQRGWQGGDLALLEGLSQTEKVSGVLHSFAWTLSQELPALEVIKIPVDVVLQDMA